MLAKVLVLALIAVASSENYGFASKLVYFEPAQHYRRQYKLIPVREPESTRETHYNAAPEYYGHNYGLPRPLHQTGHAGHQERQEANEERVIPVYQHVNEEAEEQAPVRHPIPANHYQNMQYATAAPVRYLKIPIQLIAHFEVDDRQVQPKHIHSHEQQIYQHGTQVNSAPVYQKYAAEAHTPDSHDEPVDYHARPKYQYEYKVEDPHSGDSKFQQEYRDGDIVKGVYAVQEPDGSMRIVEYSSDKHAGFNAVVKNTARG